MNMIQYETRKFQESRLDGFLDILVFLFRMARLRRKL